jgi:hypothetical protein
MTTALAHRPNLLPDTGTWKTMLEMAGQLVQSGLLPQSVKTPAAALAIIQKGQELGLPPMYALSNISVINGKPVTGAEVMLAMIYRDHGDNAVRFEDTTSERCSLTYKRRTWAQARSHEFTIEEAAQAGLTGKGGPWKQYPGAMLRARCISAVARLAFPDTIGGLYTPEELGAEVTITDEGAVEVVSQPAPVVTIVPSAHDIAPVSHAADAETRARFEANWRKGVARAVACGVTPDDKPGPEATKGRLNAAQRELLEAITARETLNAALIEKIARAREAGADFPEPVPSEMTDAEIYDQMATCDRIIGVIEIADEDEAF